MIHTAPHDPQGVEQLPGRTADVNEAVILAADESVSPPNRRDALARMTVRE